MAKISILDVIIFKPIWEKKYLKKNILLLLYSSANHIHTIIDIVTCADVFALSSKMPQIGFDKPLFSICARSL